MCRCAFLSTSVWGCGDLWTPDPEALVKHLGSFQFPLRLATARSLAGRQRVNKGKQSWITAFGTQIRKHTLCVKHHYVCIYAHAVGTKQARQHLQGFELRKTHSLGSSARAFPGEHNSHVCLSGNNNRSQTALICYDLIFFTKAHSVALCKTITKTYYLQVKGSECSSLQITVRVKMKPVQQACKIKLAYFWSRYEHLLKKHGSSLLCIWS